jgi:hypothetical protein
VYSNGMKLRRMEHVLLVLKAFNAGNLFRRMGHAGRLILGVKPHRGKWEVKGLGGKHESASDFCPNSPPSGQRTSYSQQWRIRNSGELRVSQRLNPESATDAALDYHFDPETAEHVLRLVSPMKSQMLLTEPRRATSPSLPADLETS